MKLFIGEVSCDYDYSRRFFTVPAAESFLLIMGLPFTNAY